MPEEIEGGSRKEQILKIAARMFCDRTYHGTTLQDIAKEVGMLKGSLYYYIDSKERLLADIISQAVNSLNEGLVRVEKADLVPEQRLKEIIREHVRFNAEFREAGTLFLTERHVLASLEMSEVNRIIDRRNKLLARTLEEAVKKSIYRKLDIRLASLAIIGLCNSLLFWYHPQGRLSHDEIAEGFFEMVQKGLLVR
ncbi:MAG: TetR/AcrR family transcriptional regulator [Dehalococcoidia bacterium]|nr:MAG: TetR/AcrR family transcriptional regulator [Dehalococcoidia bacterium]